MAIDDTNAIIIQYLNTASPACNRLIGLVGERIYCPRAPENIVLLDGAGESTPYVTLFTRGGASTPYIPGIITPSVQFDCWATDAPAAVVPISGSVMARNVYRALYDALQGVQNVIVGAYMILSAIEEVQGVDLVDLEIQKYFRVLTFFSIMIRAE